MKLVCAGAGEDFHATEAGVIEFRRKRIGVHANLANGTLGRQLTAAETVDEELRAIGASRGTRQSLQVGLQIVGIIGQGVQIGAGHHNGSDIAGGIGRDRAGGLFIHRDLLGFHGDGEFEVQISRLTAVDHHIGSGKGDESRGIGTNAVGARGNDDGILATAI